MHGERACELRRLGDLNPGRALTLTALAARVRAVLISSSWTNYLARSSLHDDARRGTATQTATQTATLTRPSPQQTGCTGNTCRVRVGRRVVENRGGEPIDTGYGAAAPHVLRCSSSWCSPCRLIRSKIPAVQVSPQLSGRPARRGCGRRLSPAVSVVVQIRC